jgi:hypothetical protein
MSDFKHCPAVLAMIVSMMLSNAVDAKPLKVYILAGQSNMTGMVKTSTLDHIKMSPESVAEFEAMFDDKGEPVVLDEVYVSCWPKGDGEAMGTLAPGFGGDEDSLGPEYAFGIYMHETLQEPILIIKTAQGGRSLFEDFRSPSADTWKPPAGHPDLQPPARVAIPKQLDLPADYVPGDDILPSWKRGRVGSFMGIRQLRGLPIGEVNGIRPIYVATVPKNKSDHLLLEVGDLVLAVDGYGLGDNPVEQWKRAVSRSQRSADNWLLQVTRWRKGKIETVELDLGKLLDGGRASIPQRMAKWKEQEAERDQMVGRSYRRMMDHVKKVLGDIKRVYPDYDEDAGYELAGFVWFQGWNDYVNSDVYPNRDQPRGYEQYTWLLENFIRDVRKDLAAPNLPFVIGVMGVEGVEDPPTTRKGYFQQAMAAPAGNPAFKRTVAAVQTGTYWDHELHAIALKSDSSNDKKNELKHREGLSGEELQKAYEAYRAKLITPREEELLRVGKSDGSFHYLGSAKIMCGIGKAFAQAMLQLQDSNSTTHSGSARPKADQDMRTMQLKPHPRLYIDPDTVNNLNHKLHSSYLQEVADDVMADADRLVDAEVRDTDPGDRSYQWPMRDIDLQLEYLTTAWMLTKDSKYRDAAMRHLANILEFPHISCKADRNTPANAKMWWCLSYGQIGFRVGMMYDLFRQDMTPEERQVFFALLDRWLMPEALAAVADPPWWAGKPWSNWNGVCAGGMGVMALAFYDDHPDARQLLPFVERSVGAFIDGFRENGGGFAEGVSYYVFGTEFVSRYLLSWENATGKKHPAFEVEEFGKSLNWALDFHSISFGDGGNWGPTAFFFKIADRMDLPKTRLQGAMYFEARDRVGWPQKKWAVKERHYVEVLYAADAIPTAEELEQRMAERADNKVPVARVYSPMGWAAIADDDTFPDLRMVVRGGSSEIRGHGMVDLLSIRCQINGMTMITGQWAGPHLHVTYTPRGHELFSRSPGGHSTLLVNGLGAAEGRACKSTEVVEAEDMVGIRIDGTGLCLARKSWQDMFIGRLVLLIDASYWLVIDRVEPGNGRHWVESRFMTYADTQLEGNTVSFTMTPERMRNIYRPTDSEKPETEQDTAYMQMTYASIGDAVIREAVGLPAATCNPAARILRCVDREAMEDNLHVVALNPGKTKLCLNLRRQDEDTYVIEVQEADGQTRTIRVSSELELK